MWLVFLHYIAKLETRKVHLANTQDTSKLSQRNCSLSILAVFKDVDLIRTDIYIEDRKSAKVPQVTTREQENDQFDLNAPYVRSFGSKIFY